MNLQLHHVISDITGATGLAIIDALLAGEIRTSWLLCETGGFAPVRRRSGSRSSATTGKSTCLRYDNL